MRVLLVIARLNIGGPAIQAVALTRRLSAQGVDTLLVCGRVGAHEGDMAYLAQEQGVTPIFLQALGREIMPLADVNSLTALTKLVREFRPHILHTHTAKAGALGRMVGVLWNLTHAGKERIRLVHTFHGHVFHSYFSPAKTKVFLWIERCLARFTDRIIVISPAQKEDICRRYRIAPPWKTVMLPLGFDLTALTVDNGQEARQAARLELLNCHGAAGLFLVGFVGRLAPVKNPHMFVSAAKRLQEKNMAPGLGFVFVGDGELRKDLEHEVGRLGLSDRVFFAGWRRNMAEVYQALDAVALTSLNEGTPVSLIEAMAAGLPIAATAVGGVPDLLGRVKKDLGQGVLLARRGLLIPSGDDAALAFALGYLRDNQAETRAVKTEAGRFALSAYSLDRHVKDMKDLYSELVV